MKRSHFAYPLKPILLSRQWHLDAVSAELNEKNEGVDTAERLLHEAEALLIQASTAWEESLKTQFNVDSFAVYARYVDSLAVQLLLHQRAFERALREREKVRLEAVRVRREVDAFEKHSKDMLGSFVKESLGAELKSLDDQWSSLSRFRRLA